MKLRGGLFALLAGAVCVHTPLLTSHAQPKAEIRVPAKIDPIVAAKEGQELVAKLLDQRPLSDSSSSGTLNIRDSRGKTTSVKIRFSVDVTETNVISRYVALGRDGSPFETVIIQQPEGQPNEYFLMTSADSAPKRLGRQEVMKPFAGSDFWISDLGLDFLHWPGQFVIGRGMKRGQACEALESKLPNAPPGGYARVVSWIASQDPGIMLMHADAYDSNGRILKQFDPRDVQRVQGRWQLQSIELRNRQTNSRSEIEFDLAAESASN